MANDVKRNSTAVFSASSSQLATALLPSVVDVSRQLPYRGSHDSRPLCVDRLHTGQMVECSEYGVFMHLAKSRVPFNFSIRNAGGGETT